MFPIPVEKRREMQLLEKRIIDSGLIIPELLEQARKMYNPTPFHNFLHALNVSDYVLRLPNDEFNGLEKRSMLVASIFHDAGHIGGTPRPLDEFISLSLVMGVLRVFEKDFPGFIVDHSIIRNSIMGTVFKERGKSNNRYSTIMSDFDIGCIGESLASFIYFGYSYSIELEVTVDDFFTKVEKGYFKYLIGTNKNILISPEARRILPNSYQTIKDFYKIDLETKRKMYDVLFNKDITLDEFKEMFFKK